MKRILFVALTFCILITNCKKDDEPVVAPINPKPIQGISSAYVNLDNPDISINQYNSQGTIILSYTNKKPDIRKGSIVSVDLDTMGYLRRVIDVKTEGTKMTIQTIQGHLNDIFVDKDFKLNTAILDPSQIISTKSSFQNSLIPIDKDGFIHPSTIVCFDENGKSRIIYTDSTFSETKSSNIKIIDFLEDFSNSDLYGTQGSDAHLYISEGRAGLKSDVVFEFDFDSNGKYDEDTQVERGDLKKFSFYLESTTEFKTKISLDLSKSFSKSGEKKLKDFRKKNVKFMVGTVPVWISFDCNIYGAYEFNVSTNFHADWGFESVHTLKVGDDYNGQTNTHTPIKEYIPQNTIYPLNISGAGDLTTRFEVYPRIEVLFYSVFGPFVEVVPFTEGNYKVKLQSQITQNGTETFSAISSGIDLGLDFRVGGKIDFIGKEFDQEFGPKIFNCFSLPLFYSPAKIEITSSVPIESPLNSTIPLSFIVKDNLNNPSNLCPVYLSGDGSFSKQINYTNQQGSFTANWNLNSNTAGIKKFSAKIFNAEGNLINELTGQTNAKINPILPSLITTAASSITQTTAAIGGNITSDGGAAILERGVFWGLSQNPETTGTKLQIGSGIGTFSSTLTGLSANTQYYVKAYARNSQGTAYGNQLDFTTLTSTVAPTAATTAALNISQTSATLNGNINANNLPTTVSFEYGTTTSYGQSINASPSIVTGNTNTLVTANITGLTASRTYHFRVKAVSSGGTTYGADLTFNTTDASFNGIIFNPNLTYGTVSDNDGNTYKTIQIGNQIWMAENLKTKKYNNGNSIPNVTSLSSWSALTSGAHQYYNNESANFNIYGLLYNQYAVNDSRGICPTGWHVPSDNEWKTLEIYLGMSQAQADLTLADRGTTEGGKLKEVGSSHWDTPNTGASNTSGFTALPGSYNNGTGGWGSPIGSGGFWWTSSIGIYRGLHPNKSTTWRNSYPQTAGFSVRCVKN